MRTTLSTSDAVWQHPLAQHVQCGLGRFSPEQRFVVACSGGRDSLVLADLLAHFAPDRVRLLHVNHQLHPDATQWAQQVDTWATRRGLACQVCPVHVADGNLESQARQARYQAFTQHVQPDEVLVLAHHQQDQAETLLMRLFSGSGVQGLSAMRIDDQRDGLRLWRPLLQCARSWIEQFIVLRELAVIDDPANQESQYDRVYLRQSVWPILQQRWPSVERTIARTAELMQDATEVLAEVTAQDLKMCQTPQGLSVLAVRQLSAARQRQLIATWLRGDELYAPPRHRVLAVLQLIEANGTGQVRWHNWHIRCYQGQLYRLHAQIEPHQPEMVSLPSLQIGQQIRLRSGIWQVQPAMDGLSLDLLTQRLCLMPRIGGERLHVEGRIGRWPLKKFLQHLNLPTWQRDQVQLLHGALPDAEPLAVLTPQGCFLTAASVQDQQPSWRLQRV